MKNKKMIRLKRISIILLAVVLAISACEYYAVLIAEELEQESFDELKEEIILSSNEEGAADGLNNDDIIVQENVSRFESLIAENEDFAGWIKIDGTKIDYPVMLSSSDPDFYLTHDFHKEKSKSGTPYIGKGCDPESDNIIIYGHNMKNGTMFSGLLQYKKEGFFKEHPTISFDTVAKSNEYEILSVFKDKVHYRDENVFKYYNYTGNLSEEEFNEYIKNIKAMSLYDTGVDASYGDQLITLSTCSFHIDNGRFVVVAVRAE